MLYPYPPPSLMATGGGVPGRAPPPFSPPPAEPDEPPPLTPRLDPIMLADLGLTVGLFWVLLHAGLPPELPPPPPPEMRELPGAVMPREPLPAESARERRYVIMLFTPPTT